MSELSRIEYIKDQMSKIYDADRDYEMSFYDLTENEQERYWDLKSDLEDALKES